MKDATEFFVREFVLGFGFLSGFWIAVGLNPESEIIKALGQVLVSLNTSWGWSISLIFFLLPILGIVASIAGAYQLGGKKGLIAVALAFIGGFLIIHFTIFALILVAIGIFLGNTFE